MSGNTPDQTEIEMVVPWQISPTLIEDTAEVTKYYEDEPSTVKVADFQLVLVSPQTIQHEFKLTDGPTHLGRLRGSQFDIDLSGFETPGEVLISRRHALIIRRGNDLRIEDLNSLNGTLVNGEMLPQGSSIALHVGDQITLGTLVLEVKLGKLS
ncbi:MAG: FHA domain-containing protein [Zavarzinella sp.]